MVGDDNLKVIVLAAGKGTRMKSSVPKVLHKILGKTLLERVVNTVLELENISRTFVVIGHQAKVLQDFVEKTYSVSKIPITPVIQEPQRGTGDAVFKVYDQLAGHKGTVLVLCGDTPLLTKETLRKFIEFHKQSKSALTVLSAVFDNPQNYGRIVRKSDNGIKKIVEEKDADPEEKLIKEVNAGVYCLEWEMISPAFFNLTTNNMQGEYYLTDIVDWSVQKGLKTEAFVLEDNNEIFGINSRFDLSSATYLLNSRVIESLMENGVTIIDPENTWISPETQIGQDTIVYPGCFVEGENRFGENCILGPDLYVGGNVKTENNVKIFQSRISNAIISENCSIGPFAHLRDNVELNSNIRIGNFVEVKNSSINEFTNVSHLSYIGDSDLGKNVNIGAGTITANYDPFTKQKSRTVIKDEVKTGSNSVLVAPVKISKGANVAAGSVITKDIPEYSLAIARGKQTIIEGWVSKKLKSRMKVETNTEL